MSSVKAVQNYREICPGNKCLFTYQGIGTTSKQTVTVAVYETTAGSGINFVLTDGQSDEAVKIPALATNVVNTLRNVTIGKGRARLCLVEHFLAAAAFCDAFSLDVVVDGAELPLGDGSAQIWLDLFTQAGYVAKLPSERWKLSESVFVQKGERQIIALPAQEFLMTYLMDWSHPAIGKRWCSWSRAQAHSEISKARTFGSKKEHDLLGIGGEAVSLTESGFDKALLFEDEPVRHKLLDLLGDLVLIGVNPLAIDAHFISIKGGHEMDVDLVRELQNKLEKK